MNIRVVKTLLPAIFSYTGCLRNSEADNYFKGWFNMKISIIYRLSLELQRLIIGPNVAYNPDCNLNSYDSLSSFLIETRSNVLLTRTIPAAEVLRRWRSNMPQEQSLTVICIDEGGVAGASPPCIAGVSFHLIDSSETAHPEVEAMLIAESLEHGRDERALNRDAPKSVWGGDQSVTLVGGGIINMITAYYLVNAGYKVTVLEGAADPTVSANWRLQGCTFGGNDARVFSLNEGRQHLFKGYQYTNATNTQFKLRIRDGGWLIHSPNEHDANTRDWVDVSQRLPLWLAGRFDRDIISFNQESAPLWRKMMADSPELFQEIGFKDGLLRLYATSEHYNRALVIEREIDSIIREVDLDTLGVEFPSLRDGLEAGNIAGALDVVGFSLNVHKFSRKLIKYIVSRGSRFEWGAKVTKVLRDRKGQISGLEVSNKEIISSSHYVISPGAYGNRILSGFRSENKIAGVAGLWLTMPDNAETRLDRPLKICRKGFAANGAAEGANIIGGTDTHGKPIIHVSSGHGFISLDPVRVNEEQLRELLPVVHETAQQYFPKQYSIAQELEGFATQIRYCVRPWTSTGLGLFEVAPSVNGGTAIITGGHNTGGFALSPSVGQAVLATLSGHQHRMHTLYDPDRLSNFCGATESRPTFVEIDA